MLPRAPVHARRPGAKRARSTCGEGAANGPRFPEPPAARPSWTDTSQRGSVRNACPLLLVISILALQETRTQVVSLVTRTGVRTKGGRAPRRPRPGWDAGAAAGTPVASARPDPHGRVASGCPRRGRCQLCHLLLSLGPLGPRPRTSCPAPRRPHTASSCLMTHGPYERGRVCAVAAVAQARGGSDSAVTREPPGHGGRRICA